MAQNKNALIRYKTIDKCLQNSYRRWTIIDIIDACSDALYEYEGKESAVSKRCIQNDIAMMRSDKLGYNAPIIVYEKKYYKYDDPEYSITNIPVTGEDIKVLGEAIAILKQFKEFSIFDELGGIIQKLEDVVYTEEHQQLPIIFLEKNEQLKGLEYLEILYQAILKKIAVNIEYQSFKADKPTSFVFYPYILKEYNNRWFVIGKKFEDRKITTFALDRIVSIAFEWNSPYVEDAFDGSAFYKNTIGVTVMGDNALIDARIRVDVSNAPYVLTKPFHKSQQLLEQYDDGSILIGLSVHLNYEFERLLLGFGKSLEVVAPRRLRNRIKANLKKAAEKYD